MAEIRMASPNNLLQMERQAYTPEHYDAIALLAPKLDLLPAHRHAAPRVVVSLDEPFFAALNGERIRVCHGAMLNRYVSYVCSAAGDMNAAICCYSPAGIAGAALAARLDSRPYELLREPLPPAELLVNGEGNAAKLLQKITDPLIRGYEAYYPKRLVMLGPIFQYIKRNIREPLMIADICAEVAVQPARIQQVFKESTGMTITQYIAWEKLHAILKASPAGMPLHRLPTATESHSPAEAFRIISRIFGLAHAELPAGAMLAAF